MSDGARDRAPALDVGVRALSSFSLPSPGVSMSLFAGLAVIATYLAQTLAPALPGSATGIATLINVTSFVAACTSQLVAAGGIALCLRLLGGLLVWPTLGVAFRIVIVPATLGVVLFTVTSAARPIDPEFGRIVAVAAIVAGLTSAPLLWSSPRTRSAGLVVFLAALGASFDLGAYEIARRLGPLEASNGRLGATVAAIGLGLDALAALWAFVWTVRRKRAILIGLGALLVGVVVLSLLGQAGARHTAGGVLVVVHRSLESLATRPLLALPAWLGQGMALLPLLLAATVLFIPGRKAELRAALTLCLLGRSATGAPAAALLSIGAALTALGKLMESDPRPPAPEAPLKAR